MRILQEKDLELKNFDKKIKKIQALNEENIGLEDQFRIAKERYRHEKQELLEKNQKLIKNLENLKIAQPNEQTTEKLKVLNDELDATRSANQSLQQENNDFEERLATMVRTVLINQQRTRHLTDENSMLSEKTKALNEEITNLRSNLMDSSVLQKLKKEKVMLENRLQQYADIENELDSARQQILRLSKEQKGKGLISGKERKQLETI